MEQFQTRQVARKQLQFGRIANIRPVQLTTKEEGTYIV